MKLTLGVTGLYSLFDGRIYSSSEVEHGKPAPDLFLHAAKSMGWQPSDCTVIEDSVYGVAAVISAGMSCYGFAGGLTSSEDLRAAGATPFDAMSELQSLLATRHPR